MSILLRAVSRLVFLSLLCLSSVANGSNGANLSWLLEQDRFLTRGIGSDASRGCGVVTVHALLRGDDAARTNLYLQQGVGWVIAQDRSKLMILTPAHVVSHGQQIYAQCGESVFRLRPIAQNESLDLSLLAIVDDEQRLNLDSVLAVLNPMIWLNAPALSVLSQRERQFIETQNVIAPPTPQQAIAERPRSEIAYVESGRENTPQSFRGSRVGTSGQLTIVQGHAAFFGHNQTVIYHNSGVRPGMSGSPVMIRKNGEIAHSEPMPISMIVKSESNGSNALGITINSILQFLHEYRQPSSADFFNRIGLRVESHVVHEGSGLVKKYELVARDDVSGETLRFEEICADTFPRTSDWTLVSREGQVSESLRRRLERDGLLRETPSGRREFSDRWRVLIARGKGDYGDSGGGAQPSTERRFDFRDFILSSGETVGVLRNRAHCTASGIRAPWGEVIDSLSWGDALMRVDSLSMLARVLEALKQQMEQGRLPRTTIRSLLSQMKVGTVTQWPVNNLCRVMGLRSSISLNAVWPPQHSVRGRSAQSENSQSVFSKSFLKINGNGLVQGTLGCNAEMNTYTIRSTPQSTRAEDSVIRSYTLHLQADQKLTGEIQIGDRPECRVVLSEVNVRSANMWSHVIRDAKIKGSLSLGHQYPLIRVNLYDVARECLPSGSSEVFLWEQTWDLRTSWGG